MAQYKLSKDELDFFDSLKNAYKNPYADDEKSAYNKDAVSELEAMKAVLGNISSAKGRKYAMYKMLTKSRNFNDKDLFSNVDKSYWNESNTDNYTPPDVERALIKKYQKDAENFFNWKSDKHWTKLPTKELQDKAQRAEYADFGKFMSDVGKVQTDKDTRDELSKYGMGAVQGIFTPRVYESRLKREDPSWKDYTGDVIENGLYLYNPAGRAATAGLQGSKWAGKAGVAALLGESIANPLALEGLDAAMYSDEDNTDRSKFSTGDVGIGTLVNAGMGRVAPMLSHRLFSPVKSSKAQKILKAEDLAPKEVIDKGLNAVQNELARRDLKNLSRKQLNTLKETIKEDLTKVSQSKIDNGTWLQRLGADITPGGVSMDFISNKVGDALSEDPQTQKRIIRMGAKQFGVGPFVNFLEDKLAEDKANEDLDKVNRWIELLGGK